MMSMSTDKLDKLIRTIQSKPYYLNVHVCPISNVVQRNCCKIALPFFERENRVKVKPCVWLSCNVKMTKVKAHLPNQNGGKV